MFIDENFYYCIVRTINFLKKNNPIVAQKLITTDDSVGDSILEVIEKLSKPYQVLVLIEDIEKTVSNSSDENVKEGKEIIDLLKHNVLSKYYEDFKLQWLMDHGYTLYDIINAMEETLNEEEKRYVSIPELFSTIENDIGINGEIYPCFNEWLDNEAQEEE